MANPDVLVSIPEVAKALGINKDHAYRLRKQGRLGLPTIEIGNRVYCYRADLQRITGEAPPDPAIHVLPPLEPATDRVAAALAHLDGQIAALQVQRDLIAQAAAPARRSA